MAQLMHQWTIFLAFCSCFHCTICQECIEYDISPSCSEESCLTLLEFTAIIASNESQHSCIHLNLLPGYHILTQQESNFTIEGINIFTMRVSDSNISTVLTCMNMVNSTRLELNNVTDLFIHGVTFSGCEIFATNIEQFTVKNCVFDGESSGGVALFLANTRVSISHSVLSHLQGLNFGPYANTGGAIVCKDSTIIMSDSMAIGNRAKYGGVIFAKSSCIISVRNSSFINNSADQGGVLMSVAVHFLIVDFNTELQHKIVFNNCKFSENSAHRGGVLFTESQDVNIQHSIFSNNLGSFGGVFHLNGSVLYILSSLFINNSAEWGGVIFSHMNILIYISDQSNFTGSNAISGGVIYAIGSASVLIADSYFVGNIAQFDGGVVLTTRETHISIYNSFFKHNKAGYGGGVSNGYYMHIHHSQFQSNAARDGGVFYSLGSATAYINNCQFINNTAQRYGGVYYGHFYVHSYINNSYFNSNSANVAGGAISGEFDQAMYIESSKFVNNICKQYGGAVHSAFNAIMYIRSCNFSHNMAFVGGAIHGLKASTNFSNCFFANNRAQFTGGAISLQYKKTEIHNSFFKSNIAHFSGGAVNVLYNMKTFLNTSHFTNNTAYNYGGAIYCAYNTSTDICNSTFTNNLAPGGGAIVVFDYAYKGIYEKDQFLKFSGITVISSNHAINEGGAIVAVETTMYVNDRLIVTNNSALYFAGGIFLHESRMEVSGEFLITDNWANNTGGGIYSIGSFITLGTHGSSITIAKNQALFGGGLALALNSRLYILFHSSVVHNFNLIENTADYGGAIFIGDITYYETCLGDEYSSIPTSSRNCFFQIIPENESVAIDSEIFNFTSNYANLSGDQIYGGLLDRCIANRSLESDSDDTLSNSGIMLLSQISNIDFNNSPPKSISSPPTKVSFCINNVPNVSYNSPVFHVKQGESFNISVVAVDQVNHPLRAVVKASLSSAFTGLSEGQHSQQVDPACTNLTFTVTAPDHIKEEKIVLHPDGPCGDGNEYLREIKVQLEKCQCPVGFQRNKDVSNNCVCICHRNITKLVMNCNSITSSFTRKQNSWISYINTSYYNPEDSLWYYLLIHEHCPYDYCSQLSQNSQDGVNKQCGLNRDGILCGKCQLGFSVSIGSSKCIKCTSSWPAWLILLLVVTLITGFALVFVILFLNLTVAIGTINGIIFYANIIAANRTVLVRLPSLSFPLIFISWINLDIGFDACFYNGMDTYAKTWLQMAFPAYLIILIVVVIVSSKYSESFSSLIGKKNPVATLATLILLSYAKILSAILKIVSNTELIYPDGPRTLWLPDANITFLKDSRHILLFFVGILIIIIGTAYTFMLFSWQWLLQLPDWKLFNWTRFPRLNSFMETYQAPYNCNYRYWTGLLLLVRVILYLVSALNTSGNPKVLLLATILVTGILILLDKKDRCNNSIVGLMESAIYLNILILVAFSWYGIDSPRSDHLHIAAIYISTLTIFVQLILVIVYHSYRYTKLQYLLKSTKLYKSLQRSEMKKERPKGKCGSQTLANLRHVKFKVIDESAVQADYV